MKMRLMKDTTFEEIIRRQLFYNIKEGIKVNLDKKELWDINTNLLKDTGPRGAIFIFDKEELTSLFK
eukprot:1543461-Heterocapsa_arctica.AAC.1